MGIVTYLPSSQFSVTVVSIAAAGVLVLGAQYITQPKNTTPELSTAPDTVVTADWQTSLAEVQATAPGLPEAPSEDSVQALLTAAQSSNITTSVARSLFINLGSSGSHGLGSDIPTQDKLIADAASRVGSVNGKQYQVSDLSIKPADNDNLHSWGNAVMQTFIDHPRASNDAALYAIAYATDHNDTSSLSALTVIGQAYADLAEELAGIPVPQTLSPLYLQLINKLSKMAAASGEMKTVINDPLRGLVGLQTFQTSGAEAVRVLTTMSEQLSKGGILFSKGEPGTSWNVFVSPYLQ